MWGDGRDFQIANKTKRRKAPGTGSEQHLSTCFPPEYHFGKAWVIIGKLGMPQRLGTESQRAGEATSMRCVYTHTCLCEHTELCLRTQVL